MNKVIRYNFHGFTERSRFSGWGAGRTIEVKPGDSIHRVTLQAGVAKEFGNDIPVVVSITIRPLSKRKKKK